MRICQHILKGKDVVQIIYINSVQQVGQLFWNRALWQLISSVYLWSMECRSLLHPRMPFHSTSKCPLLPQQPLSLQSQVTKIILLYHSALPFSRGRSMQFFCCTIRYFEETSEKSVSTSENHSVSNTPLALSVFCFNALFQNNNNKTWAFPRSKVPLTFSSSVFPKLHGVPWSLCFLHQKGTCSHNQIAFKRKMHQTGCTVQKHLVHTEIPSLGGYTFLFCDQKHKLQSGLKIKWPE